MSDAITLTKEDLENRARVREFVDASYKGSATEVSEDQRNADVDAIIAQANAYYGWLQSRSVPDQLAALGAPVASHPGDTPSEAAPSDAPPVVEAPNPGGAVTPGANL